MTTYEITLIKYYMSRLSEFFIIVMKRILYNNNALSPNSAYLAGIA